MGLDSRGSVAVFLRPISNGCAPDADIRGAAEVPDYSSVVTFHEEWMAPWM